MEYLQFSAETLLRWSDEEDKYHVSAGWPGPAGVDGGDDLTDEERYSLFRANAALLRATPSTDRKLARHRTVKVLAK